MPAYHSKLSGFDGQVVCGCAILPLKLGIGESRGPAPRLDSGDSQDDIIDETLFLYRANSLFRNYLPEGPADRTLIYLTLFVQQCLKVRDGEYRGVSCSNAGLALPYSAVFFCVIGKSLTCMMAFKIRDTVMGR